MAIFRSTTGQLDAAIRAVCPIIGVSVGKDGVPSTVRIDFAPEATVPQRAAAQAVVDAFDWSTAAEEARLNVTQRQRADELLSSRRQEAKLQRAVAAVLVDEVNVVRQWLAALKTQVAAATNFADLKARVATLPATPDRTLAQARTAIQNRLAGGTVDT